MSHRCVRARRFATTARTRPCIQVLELPRIACKLTAIALRHCQASVNVIKKEIDASLAATQQKLAATQTANLNEIHPVGGAEGCIATGDEICEAKAPEGGAADPTQAEATGDLATAVQAVVRPQAAPVAVAPGIFPSGDIVTI